jgi:hypothetical protein
LRARIKELQTTISDGVVALEIRTRSTRVQALQKRWDYLRAGLELVLDQRGADMVDVPVAASGLLVRNYKGKGADRLVTPHRSRRGLAGRGTALPRAQGGRRTGVKCCGLLAGPRATGSTYRWHHPPSK